MMLSAATAVTCLAVPFGRTGVSLGGRISGDAAIGNKKQQSAPMRLGENSPLAPPFCETFDNFNDSDPHSDFERLFQVIDNDGEGRTWWLYNVTVADGRKYGRCAYMKFPIDVSRADDWLVTRAVKLEKGKYYNISVDASLWNDGSANTPQMFEVKLGRYNDVAGLNTVIVPETKVTTSEMTHYQGWYKPAFTAIYYVAVHGTSPRYGSDYYNYLFVDNIAVDAPRQGGEPGEISGLKLVNDPDGSSAVGFTFSAPTAAIDGTALSGQMTIEVKREGKTVKTLTAVAPGSEVSFSDVPEEPGRYLYTITASNSIGTGATAYKMHTAGIVNPVAPTVTGFEETEPGLVKLTWSAPTEDVNGNAINPEKLVYTVTDCSGEYPEIIGEEIEATEFEYDFALSPNEQKMVRLALTAKINGNESEPAVAGYLNIGTPYELPYHNSFTLTDYYDYVMAMETVEGVNWIMLDDHSDPKAQDGDNGYLCMVGTAPNQRCELQFGKVNLENTLMPMLTFYTYVYEGDENEINVSFIDCTTGKRHYAPAVMLENYNRGWQKVKLNLNEVKGRPVQVCLEGVIRTHGYLPIDNVLIEDLPAVDLEAAEVDAPRYGKPGEVLSIMANIVNNGRESVGNYTVTLLDAAGEELTTVEGQPIESQQTARVELTTALGAVSDAINEFRVRVDCPDDTRKENNLSAVFNIALDNPMHPVATNLQAVENEDGTVSLTWTAPDMSKVAPEQRTDGFEDYEAFTTPFGNWTTVTYDEGLVGGISGVDMPVTGTKQAFWIMALEGAYNFLPTHGGEKVAVAMYGVTEAGKGVASDDWLISPELFGGAQTIDFWASAATDTYGPEHFEVYYSTSGTAPGDFMKLQDDTECPSWWVNYRIALPEGSKYFAIRYVSNNVYFFMVDDVTFIPAGTPRQLEFKGYNVYRNAMRLNAAPVAETRFTADAAEGENRYYVTAVYDRGESLGSNVVTLGESGIDEIVTGESTGARYYNLQGIEVKNPVRGVYIRTTPEGSRKVIR